jgi:hypothetical protein
MKKLHVLLAAVGLCAAAVPAFALTVTQTADGNDLKAALGGSGLTINSVSAAQGHVYQFGTYTGFNSAPVTIGDGVVLSTGVAVETTAAYKSAGDSPSNDMGGLGSAEFDNYGSSKITNFNSSNDVAKLQVNFTLATASKVGFDFVFGSVEYPVYVDSYTDAFLAFLDGTGESNQIVFDTNNKPVQVGSSFVSLLTTADTNTAFSGEHGLMALKTFTNTLSAGNHTLTFEIGDVNDGVLDSGVFISNLRTGTGGTITGTYDDDINDDGTDSHHGDNVPVPEPGTFLLLGAGLAGLGFAKKRLQKNNLRRV